MRTIDFSSWQGLLTTIISLALFTLIGVGVRLLTMVTIQQRRERLNRQINERLRTLIAAYKTLGGSFTGDLTVDPAHLRELRRRGESEAAGALDLSAESVAGSDRTRRIRDAVEAALSDIVLLGTQEHVRLAVRAADELVAGRPVHTAELVVALRAFIRDALDLDVIPPEVVIPRQGPTRPSGSGGRDKGERGKASAGGGGGGGAGGGGGMGMGMGGGLGTDSGEEPPPARPA